MHRAPVLILCVRNLAQHSRIALCAGTIDDVMWKNVNTKQSNVGNILDGHDEGTAQGTWLLF